MRALVLAIATLISAPAAALAQQAELVGEVTSASVWMTGPHTVTVCARGTVPTGGWREPQIRPAPRATVHAGIYDLDFTAVRPSGLATQMVSPITATFVWRSAPADLKGVRVRGLQSAALAYLGQDGGC